MLRLWHAIPLVILALVSQVVCRMSGEGGAGAGWALEARGSREYRMMADEGGGRIGIASATMDCDVGISSKECIWVVKG